MSNKTRLDVLLVERGFAPTRQKAQAIIMAGSVFVAGQRADKPGTAVANEAELEVRGHTLRYVSRGGLKLEKAMQTFPIKMCIRDRALTGRQALFETLRQFGGLSGFPKPYESEHDAFIAGHASNSVSVALGMARARTLRHEDYSVLALIGDGAMSGGLSFEGLNNAGASQEPLIVILNDNGMSINPNVGGLSRHLAGLRTKSGYYQFKKWYRDALEHLSLIHI